MITKNIFKIHPLTYIVCLLFVFLGYFNLYLSFFIVLIIHELGHIFFSLVFKWKIKQIIFMPLGLLLKFEDNLNKPLIEEFIISIMGIIFQLIFILFIHNNNLITASNIILLFNIIPIYPLDGSKVLNIVLNKITNFKNSYFLTLIVSLFTIIIILSISLINLSLLPVISMLPLLKNIIELFCERNNVFIKFLLERYLYSFNFKRNIIIYNINDMKRDCYHYFYINNNKFSEKEMLKRYFNLKK